MASSSGESGCSTRWPSTRRHLQLVVSLGGGAAGGCGGADHPAPGSQVHAGCSEGQACGCRGQGCRVGVLQLAPPAAGGAGHRPAGSGSRPAAQGGRGPVRPSSGRPRPSRLAEAAVRCCRALRIQPAPRRCWPSASAAGVRAPGRPPASRAAAQSSGPAPPWASRWPASCCGGRGEHRVLLQGALAGAAEGGHGAARHPASCCGGLACCRHALPPPCRGPPG